MLVWFDVSVYEPIWLINEAKNAPELQIHSKLLNSNSHPLRIAFSLDGDGGDSTVCLVGYVLCWGGSTLRYLGFTFKLDGST